MAKNKLQTGVADGIIALVIQYPAQNTNSFAFYFLVMPFSHAARAHTLNAKENINMKQSLFLERHTHLMYN